MILDDTTSEYDSILENARPLTENDLSLSFDDIPDFFYQILRTEHHTIIYPNYDDHQNSLTPVIFIGHPSLIDIANEYHPLIEDFFSEV